MKKLFLAAIALASVSFVSPNSLAAQDTWPTKPAEYVEVSAVHVKDGYDLKYLRHLADMWRKNMDYRAEKGWIESYEILRNIHARDGEPSLYLITRYNEIVTPEEGRKRRAEMRAMTQMTAEEIQESSADRADYRRLGGTMMLRRLEWND